MSTPCRFDDKEYTDWIKCSRALILFKEGLHDFIKTEVTNFYAHIQQNITNIPGGSSAGSQCGSCTWKSIKHTGGQQGVWYINCQNKICDKWLSQILREHNDPQNRSINWKNADIRKWPTDGYEVAKVYMPKGQDKAKNLPNDFDAPAVLSLLKYCAWFTKKIQTTSILSDLIDIRNDVMHSGDLRVTESKMNSCIDKIIQLMSELNLHGDVCTELQMTKGEDIVVNFRKTEVRALHNLVLSIKGKLDYLQDAQTQQMHGIEEVEDKITETEEKIVTLETDIQNVKLEVEQLTETYQKIKSFLASNPDIHDKNISENIQAMEKTVRALESKFEKKQEELERKITSIERGIKRKFEEIEEKMETKQITVLEGMSEAPKKRRPETDGLKHLKYQTEDKLDTLRRLKCIPTKQAEEAKKLLEGKRSIVIRGNPGEGKTTTALHLIDNEMYKDKRVVLYSPQDWKTVDTEWVVIVVLEDMLGQFDFDSGRLQEWMVYLPTVQEHVDAGKLKVIITTRDDILSSASSMLGSLKLFSNDLTLTLSSKQLKDSEKMSILNRELQRHNKNLKEDQKEKCIANFSGLVGFPHCCLLFAGDSKSFDRGPDFFKSPCKFFVANITELEATRFLSLAFLFCNGKIWEENLSPDTMPEIDKQLLMQLASHLHISERNASVTLLRHAYDSFLELYVVKSVSYDFRLWSFKPCIQFTHATICEAVGKVLGGRCPEIVVKCGDSEYLYQRTYTAKAKDSNSQNVFIPVSLYGLLAERMVHDVVDRGLIRSVVKHSSLKQYDYLKKLKFEFQKSNRIKDFFIAHYSSWIFQFSSISGKDLSEGYCDTFMEYVLQNDKEVVTLVYNEFLEFLACAHSYNTSDCWQCEHKQKLMELALYYHHFQIADKLITMNACYTHVSLCNAAKHGDLVRVQTILEALKRSKIFNPGCKEVKYAFCRACISGNQSLIEFLIQEGIIADSRQVVDAVQYGDISVLKKVVEHLKSRNNWNPHWEPYSTHENFRHLCQQFRRPVTYLRERKENSIPYSTALLLSFCNKKFDMADYLLKNDVNALLSMLPALLKYNSVKVVARVIQYLKDTENWDPKCNTASEVLEIAYRQEKYDVCDLLVQEGVSLTMKKFPCLVYTFEHIKKAIQNFKDTGSWDPNCDDARKALEYAYLKHKYDVCDLLVEEGVSLTMNTFPCLVHVYTFEHIKKAIQNFKDTDNWDPKCDHACKALEYAYLKGKYDVCDLLVQEGVSLTMKNLSHMVDKASLESINKAIQTMKDTDIWDPKCNDAVEVLGNAYNENMYDVCDLLAQEGISISMKNVPDMVNVLSFESIKKAIQHMKDTGNWDPKCDDASRALEHAYNEDLFYQCDLLIQEGVSPSMKNLPYVVSILPSESIKEKIQNMNDIGNWDPKSDDGSRALENAYNEDLYDQCDLLIQEGISLTMENLPSVVDILSFESMKKAIQNMKDTGNWDPKCAQASRALENAYDEDLYDQCDLLIQEGVSLTMENLPYMVDILSFESMKKAIQNMKDTGNWDPKCDDASRALENAYNEDSYDVCDLLIQEGVSLTMMNLLSLVYNTSFESIKKAIKNLKDTDNWDPKCDDAFEALNNTCKNEKYDVCDMLVQEGVSLTMKNLPYMVDYPSFAYIKNAIQNLKDNDNWDPKCYCATDALEIAYEHQKYDVCDLLVQEGVSLTMKNLPRTMGFREISTENVCIIGKCSYLVSMHSVQKVIKHLKDTANWDPKCEDASKALEKAFNTEKYDICDLLFQELISFPMKHFPNMVSSGSFEYVKKALQNLKATSNWDPDGDYAFRAFENSFIKERYDVCDLLVQEGILFTMKNLSSVVSSGSFGYIKRTIQLLQDTDNWDPECDHASKALEMAYRQKKDDVCYLLIRKGILLTMKNQSH